MNVLLKTQFVCVVCRKGSIFGAECVIFARFLKAGDGGAGGGISLAGTWWDKMALAIAKEVTVSFDGDLQIYAFRTLRNSAVQVRIEKLSNK